MWQLHSTAIATKAGSPTQNRKHRQLSPAQAALRSAGSEACGNHLGKSLVLRTLRICCPCCWGSVWCTSMALAQSQRARTLMSLGTGFVMRQQMQPRQRGIHRQGTGKTRGRGLSRARGSGTGAMVSGMADIGALLMIRLVPPQSTGLSGFSCPRGAYLPVGSTLEKARQWPLLYRQGWVCA